MIKRKSWKTKLPRFRKEHEPEITTGPAGAIHFISLYTARSNAIGSVASYARPSASSYSDGLGCPPLPTRLMAGWRFSSTCAT
jgi:hypothetical protein